MVDTLVPIFRFLELFIGWTPEIFGFYSSVNRSRIHIAQFVELYYIAYINPWDWCRNGQDYVGFSGKKSCFDFCVGNCVGRCKLFRISYSTRSMVLIIYFTSQMFYVSISLHKWSEMPFRNVQTFSVIGIGTFYLE